MSPTETGPVIAPRISKRGRPVEENANEPPQRARKRALDREAQRTFRDKTKNYIAHLERTVELCKADNQDQLVSKLLAENATLYSTIERLRKIISDIFAVTQPEILERHSAANSEGPKEQGASPDKTDRAIVQHSSPTPPEGNLDPTITITHESQALCTGSIIAANVNATALDASSRNGSPYESTGSPGFVHSTQGAAFLNGELSDLVDITVFMGGSIANQTIQAPISITGGHENFHHRENDQISLFSPPLRHLQPGAQQQEQEPGSSDRQDPSGLNDSLDLGMNSSMDVNLQFLLDSPAGRLSPCIFPSRDSDLWDQTNHIYNQIFVISPQQARHLTTSDQSLIFKAIKDGWESLTFREQQNPVISILWDYDKLIIRKMDRVNRLAIAYKNYSLIKARVDWLSYFHSCH